jgi:hypothetical protein
VNTLQVHRLTLALTYLLEYAPKEHPDDDIDYQYQQALVNAAAILNNHAKIKWLVWQNNLVARLEAACVLSDSND